MAYSKDPEKRLFVGSIELDATLGVAKVAGTALPLGKKVVATLAALAERTGEVVPKGELLRYAWGEAAIDDSSLWQNIHVLRGVLSAHAPNASIETVKGRGYCLKIAAPAVPTASESAVRSTPRWTWPVAAALACGIAIGGIARQTPPQRHHIVLFVTGADGASLPPLPPLK